MSSADSFSPFGDTFLTAVTRTVTEQLEQEVDRADLSCVASVNPAEYAAGLAAKFEISPLAVDVDRATMSPREETVRAERFDFYSGRQAGDLYTRQIVTVHTSFTGDPALFRCQASTRTICPRPIWLAGAEVCFEVIVPTHASADVKGEVKRMLTCLSENTRHLDQEIARFNQSLLGLAKSFVDRRRAELQQRLGILETLDLPLKKADAVPATGSLPIVRRRSYAPRAERTTDIGTHSFLVAFSFPGEARHRIGGIATLLEERLGPGSVFYDEWYKAELARPNLDLHLQGVYARAKLVVVCLCAEYERKEWCGLEWRAIRDLIKRRQDKVMFLRSDDAPVAGAFSIDGYLDLRTHNDNNLVGLICQRVTGKRQDMAPSPAIVPDVNPDESYRVSEPPGPELSSIEQARRNHVAGLLERAGQEELRVLTHLALHGRTDVSAVNKMCSDTVPINNLLLADLVKHIPAPPGAPSFQQFYELNQRLLEATIFHLKVRGLL